MITLLGKHWAHEVTKPSNKLDNIKGVQRLGEPGRQGTVIKLVHGGRSYAIKVTQKGDECGDGLTGGMGFLKQARLQELAAEFNVTGHVYAISCGYKNKHSFMVMDLMGERLIDI